MGFEAPMSHPSEAAFRAAMGRFVTGVTVVSTVVDGVDHAMTANAVASVSLEPPLVLHCVQRDSRFHDAVVAAGVWGLSVLSAQSRGAAQWLATAGRPLDGQLDPVPHHRGAATGVALLEGSLATLECRTIATYPGGDHLIVVGEVVAVQVPQAVGEALIYYRGGYQRLS